MTSDDRLITNALQEALLFLTAPEGSARHWPVSRANLTSLLKEALKVQKARARRNR